ncbi:MAG: glutamate racemase [Pseudomonadota bacterium]
MPPVLVFDSGVGGLSVLRAIVEAAPDLPVSYLADNALFPYGAMADDVLIARAIDVIGHAKERIDPSCVVIACNTASTLVLEPLRARFDMPFVGIVPAIKPAAEQTNSHMVSVLATPGTVRRDYTQALIDTYASHVDVTLVGGPHLAAEAEKLLAGRQPDKLTIGKDIASCFVERNSARTDTIALACTHYPLLQPVFEAIAPWPVTWIDPAPAIARRVLDILPQTKESDGEAGVLLHTGPAPNSAIVNAFAMCGVDRPERLPV